MTPQPPREYIAFVASHLSQLRQRAQLLAGDEYEAHQLYSQALTDTAIRWPWFALLRRCRRPGAPEAFLHRTLIRRSTRLATEQADFVEFEVWLSDHPEAMPPPGRPPSGPPSGSPAGGSSRTARALPLSSFGVEIGPVTEAAVAWFHAYTAHRHARWSATTAAVVLVLAIVLPFLQRH